VRRTDTFGELRENIRECISAWPDARLMLWVAVPPPDWMPNIECTEDLRPVWVRPLGGNADTAVGDSVWPGMWISVHIG
jgi:hypothetical protein